ELVANIDVAPTLLDVAGITVDGMDGGSFLPLVRGEKPEGWRDALLYEYFWERNYPQTPTQHALRDDRYKYIRYHGIWDVDELYDLEADPEERRNLIFDPDQADRVQAMNERLFDLLHGSGGDSLRLLEDRGTKFYHRRDVGSRGAAFPPDFYRPAGTSGK
ncbi:MAG: sulfatase/phosphatase domain-containing protein, partial [Verrucomicrobiota bacterium]